MPAAFIEHRPLASNPNAGTAHHAVVVGVREIETFKTQRETAEWAKSQGYNQYMLPGSAICRTAMYQTTGDTTRKLANSISFGQTTGTQFDVLVNAHFLTRRCCL